MVGIKGLRGLDPPPLCFFLFGKDGIEYWGCIFVDLHPFQFISDGNNYCYKVPFGCCFGTSDNIVLSVLSLILAIILLILLCLCVVFFHKFC